MEELRKNEMNNGLVQINNEEEFKEAVGNENFETLNGIIENNDVEARKKMLTIRVYDKKDKEKIDARMWIGCPHIDLDGEFVAFAALTVRDAENEGVFNIMVNGNIVEETFESEEEMFEIAMLNIGKPRFSRLSDVIIMGENAPNLFEELDEECGQREGYIIRMDGGVNEIFGSSILAVDGIYKKIGDRLGCSYWLCPSSTEECIVVPDDGVKTADELNAILHDGNLLTNPKDVLSWNVRRYDAETEKVAVC